MENVRVYMDVNSNSALVVLYMDVNSNSALVVQYRKVVVVVLHDGPVQVGQHARSDFG